MVLRKFSLLPNTKCSLGLDLGCGPGENLTELIRLAEKVIGVDVDGDAIQQAKQKCTDGRVSLLQADAGGLPLADACADLAVLSEVLEHCREERQVIAEVKRVLRPGGILLVTSPHRGPFLFLDPLNFGFYFPRPYRWLGLAARRRRKGENEFHRHYRLSDLMALLDGFEVQRVHRGGLVLHPLISWIDAAIVKFLAGRVPEPWRRQLYHIAAREVSVPFGAFAYDIWITARKR